MFQSSLTKLRALFDDLLGDPEPPAPHPHRRPVRIQISRRPGTVPPAPAHCLSPVRPTPGRSRREYVG